MAHNPSKHPFPSLAALAMARASKRLAAEYDDQDLAARAELLEQRALEAIGDGKHYLPEPN